MVPEENNTVRNECVFFLKRGRRCGGDNISLDEMTIGLGIRPLIIGGRGVRAADKSILRCTTFSR